jgi:hypothetical protein
VIARAGEEAIEGSWCAQQSKIAALEKANHDLGWQVAMLTRARADQPSPSSRLRGALPEDAHQDSAGDRSSPSTPIVPLREALLPRGMRSFHTRCDALCLCMPILFMQCANQAEAVTWRWCGTC